MRGSVRISRISSFAGAVAALWLCGTGSAWAGGGGHDAGTLQSALLKGLCDFLGMTSCPQLPTISQIVLETSALENTPPNLVRSQVMGIQLTGISGACSVAGNLSVSNVVLPVCDTLAINAVNPPAGSNPASPSSLTPLAFISPLFNPAAAAAPVPPGPNNGANSFFYGVKTGANGANGQPDKLTLFFDYLPLTNAAFTKGQTVAKISLPLQVLNLDGTERLVCGTRASQGGCSVSVATLQISASCTGGLNCLTANVIGDFSKQGTTETRSAAALGLLWSVDFGTGHAIFEVQAPLLVTGPTDPAYFGVVPPGATLPNGSPNPNVGSPTDINQASGLPTAFKTDDLGFTPGFLGTPVGIAPFAAPPCPGGLACPPVAPGALPPPSTFPFCASFLAGGAIHSAVAAFLAIGTDGTTYVTSPIPPVVGVQCPF